MFQRWRRRGAPASTGETSELLPPEYDKAEIVPVDGETAVREAICRDLMGRREADVELHRLRERGVL